MNILLIILVLGIAGYLVFYVVKKKKTAEVETTIDVDDKTYTINKTTTKDINKKYDSSK